MIDGKHAGTGGGNHVVVGRRDDAGQPVPAAAGSAALPDPALAAASVDLVSVLGALHRPDQPGAADRRGAARFALRAGDRAQPDAAAGVGRGPCPVAGRPAAAEPAGGRDGQYAPGGDLHRQALFAGRADRAAGAGRVPRLRDAAGPADEPGAAADDPGADRAALARAGDRAADALGDGAARPLHAAAFRLGGFPRRAARSARAWLRHAARLVRGAGRVPLPVLRRGRGRRGQPRAPAGAGAVARAGRDRGDRRDGALHRQFGRAAAGEADRHRSGALCRRLQQAADAVAADRRAAGCRWRRCASRRGSRRRRCIR